MNVMLKPISFLLLLAIALALVIMTPVLLIWSLNTLFALAIPFTLYTWAAAALLVAIFAPSPVKFKREVTIK